MKDSSLGRYRNLIRNIRNWPAYFTQKSSSNFLPAKFTTRGGSLTFDVPSRGLYLVFKEIFLTDFYSIDEWISKLPPNPVIVDVGANVGYFDTLVLSRRPDSVVFAYEPIERNITIFNVNISLNPLMQERISLFHRAVTGKPVESIQLFKEADTEDSVTASVFQDFESHNLNSVSIKAISLAQIIEENNLSQIDFLKLDCEGSEYPILYDTPVELWKRVSIIFLEVHDLDNERRNFEALKKFLESVGFNTTSQLANNGCHAVFATRK